MTDFTHRDHVMRAWFEGRDWDKNPEFLLKRRLVHERPAVLAPFPLLLDDEWEVVPGATNSGRGDLLFTDGQGAYAVVEVKSMPALLGGRTARGSRNKKRSGVREQALTYARAVFRIYPDAREVSAFTFTDDWMDAGLRLVRVLPREDYERERLLSFDDVDLQSLLAG